MKDTVKDVIMPENWYDALPRQQYSCFVPVQTTEDWFRVYQIYPDIYAIYEDKHFQEVISYLITADDKAMMIDTGLGIGNIKSVTDALCDKEVFVVHTHTHFDHIGGDWQYGKSYVLDDPIAVKRMRYGLSAKEVEKNVAEGSTWQPYPRGFDPLTYCIRPAASFSTFRNGDVFEVGKRRFEVIETPGHSPDSVMFADRENRILFTGDSFYPATLYAHITHNDGSNSDFETYRQSMRMVADQFSDFTLITSHNEPLRPGIELRKVADAFDLISEGSLPFISDEKGLKKYVFDDFCITL